jgi:hypothetical protein
VAHSVVDGRAISCLRRRRRQFSQPFRANSEAFDMVLCTALRGIFDFNPVCLPRAQELGIQMLSDSGDFMAYSHFHQSVSDPEEP